jgi:DNA repair protein RadA/Sms
MQNNPIDHSVVAFGEISLAGEIRPVASSKQRASEAARLGFRTRVDESVGRLQNAIDRAFGTIPSDDVIPEF